MARTLCHFHDNAACYALAAATVPQVAVMWPPLLLVSPSYRRWCQCAPVAWQGLALICGTCIQKLISKNKRSGWLTLSLSPRNGRLRSGGRSRVVIVEQRRQNNKTKLIT